MSSTAASRAEPRTPGPSMEARAAEYRYAAVFVLLLVVVVFVITVPGGNGARAVTLALASAALLFAVSTSQDRTSVRRRRAVFGTVLTLIAVGAIAIGVLGIDLAFLLSASVIIAIPVSLSRGLLRLVRKHGATAQAVAGALAIYLAIGLAFASVIGFVADVESGHYFVQGATSSASDDVYYSFTVLTTTGFGDFTAAHHFGRALAVAEMLVGQLYLVTVIGILVGRRVGQTR